MTLTEAKPMYRDDRQDAAHEGSCPQQIPLRVQSRPVRTISAISALMSCAQPVAHVELLVEQVRVPGAPVTSLGDAPSITRTSELQRKYQARCEMRDEADPLSQGSDASLI
ncbi:hypothetical protein [Paraburkholderia solisilvae]|uniref:hypothetical protein n=1 Tax=Paraburkholderia solisilvae TaxID=624376 RepID=UPI001583F4E9|nr:hypothetical protein [Paraburkholderia solisilvae]